MKNEPSKVKRIWIITVAVIALMVVPTLFVTTTLSTNSVIQRAVLSDPDIPSNSRIISIKASDTFETWPQEKTVFGIVTLSAPRKEFYHDNNLSGHIQLNCHVFLTKNHTGMWWEKFRNLLNGASTYANVELIWPHFSITLNNIKQAQNQEPPLNLAADLERAINDQPLENKTNSLTTEGYVLLAELYAKAKQNQNARHSLNLAKANIQNHPELIPQYQKLHNQISNPTSPEL